MLKGLWEVLEGTDVEITQARGRLLHLDQAAHGDQDGQGPRGGGEARASSTRRGRRSSSTAAARSSSVSPTAGSRPSATTRARSYSPRPSRTRASGLTVSSRGTDHVPNPPHGERAGVRGRPDTCSLKRSATRGKDDQPCSSSSIRPTLRHPLTLRREHQRPPDAHPGSGLRGRLATACRPSARPAPSRLPRARLQLEKGDAPARRGRLPRRRPRSARLRAHHGLGRELRRRRRPLPHAQSGAGRDRTGLPPSAIDQ